MRLPSGRSVSYGRKQPAMPLLTLLLVLIFLMAQNGLAVMGVAAKWNGQDITNSWHVSHYDVVMGDKTVQPANSTIDCYQIGHVDFKPLDLVTLGKLLWAQAVLPALLLFFLFPFLSVASCGRAYRSCSIHRNSLPLLIRSTVLHI